jgi:hypothetical protein
MAAMSILTRPSYHRSLKKFSLRGIGEINAAIIRLP